MINTTEDTSYKGLTVHVYAKGAPAEEGLPVTVKAPIITDGTTAEGVQPLLDFVKSIEAHSNTAVAAEESKRLQLYFSALSIYLTRARKEASWIKKKPQKGLITPEALKAAFNAMADYTRVTFTSEVVIMPDNIKEGPAAPLFKDAFNPTFKYGDHPFSFGFLKIFEGGDEATARSSTTIPTFMLDAKLMKEIAPHLPTELYRRFQAVVTDMNHDMLHHLHSPGIVTTVAHKFNGDDSDNKISRWSSALPSSGFRSGIEEWSQISHGKVFMTPGNEALVEEVAVNIDRYFDELERIGNELKKKEDIAFFGEEFAKIKTHEVVDYFGTVMAQTLSRTFPFNHPLMTQCLDRMQTADPFSEQELLEAAIKQYSEMKWGRGAPSASLEVIRRSMVEKIVGGGTVETMANIVKGYRQQGFDILPNDDKAVNFKGLKLLQLARIETDEIRSHVPTPVGEMEQKVRAKSDRAFLNLVSAVATTTGYSPK